MKRIYLSLMFTAALVFTGCKNENTTADERVDEDVDMVQDDSEMMTETEEAQDLTVQIQPKSDSNLSGEIRFSEENGEVTMTADFSGLKQGMHAIHIHEKGDCSAPDATSAGGHWNPTNEQHGEWGDANGYHRGDIGNFDVNADGEGSITFTTEEWCLGCDDADRNIIGKAVVVHDGADDFTSQPSGAAGKRIGCAEIKK